MRRAPFGQAEFEALLDDVEAGRGARDAVLVPVPSASPLAVSEVRSTVSAIVDPALDAANHHEVQLVSSELLTNALQHGDPPVQILLHETTDAVVVAVFDRGSGEPLPEPAATTGLRIVAGLCHDNWGVVRRSGGKWVWAALARA